MQEKSKEQLKELSDDLLSIQSKMLGWMDELLTDALNPESLLRFFGGIGLDMSGMSGIPDDNKAIDPYRILGLERSASDEEVKRRYRELLMKLHPDTAGVEGTDFLVQMIVTAYQLIARERGWQ